MKTLLLDIDTWDLVIDADGNIAVAGDPYATAQDAASTIRLFLGELWYDTSKGVPYWIDILGKAPPINLIRQRLEEAAMTVPGIEAARCFFIKINDREVTGQVQVSDQAGRFSIVTFNRTPNAISASVAA